MVRFWDTSALVPLLVEEATSESCRVLLQANLPMVVWALTRTELASAVWRRARAGDIELAAMPVVIDRLAALAARWNEVTDLDLVRDRADRLLAVHALRAADALQLAAALVVCEERPKGRDFITSDGALATCARAEDFTVIVPKG